MQLFMPIGGTEKTSSSKKNEAECAKLNSREMERTTTTSTVASSQHDHEGE